VSLDLTQISAWRPIAAKKRIERGAAAKELAWRR